MLFDMTMHRLISFTILQGIILAHWSPTECFGGIADDVVDGV